jgi:hypothetical protein
MSGTIIHDLAAARQSVWVRFTIRNLALESPVGPGAGPKKPDNGSRPDNGS